MPKSSKLSIWLTITINQSFSSVSPDNEWFKKMFPESEIARAYKQSETKVMYSIKFGIAPFLKQQMMNRLKGVPFTFKFDETTACQVKKQYDAYVQFWDIAKNNEVITAYLGSLFVGHCSADQLVEHFTHFINELKLDPQLFIGLGMDGPNVNLSFEKKLRKHLEESFGTSFLHLGTCSLHPAHTAFRKGLSCLSHDIDEFLHDLHFFLKLSSARQEDYASLQALTDVIAYFMLKHCECRWLSMKKVAVRVLEQYPNLKKYFLEFLPRAKGFRKLSKTDRYKRIAKALNDPLSEFYVAFCAFA